MDLAQKKCVPREDGTPPIQGAEIQEYLKQLPSGPAAAGGVGWTVENEAKLKKEFGFASFRKAIDFVTRVARLAETENHHPDILIFYKWVTIQLWTRSVGGLSENDFILAAKIEQLAGDK